MTTSWVVNSDSRPDTGHSGRVALGREWDVVTITGELPRTRSQRRLSSVELFPAVPVVVAGYGQGSLYGTGQHSVGI